MRIATALPHSSRKTRSTSCCMQRLLQHGTDLDRAVPSRRGSSEARRIASSRSGRSMRKRPPIDLLRLGERAVRDDALAVADANDLRGRARRRAPCRTRSDRPCRAPRRARPMRASPRARSAALSSSGRSAQRGVVVVDEHRVVHSCTSSGSTWTGRTSTAPCSAPGIRAAQSSASSIDAHSRM